MILAFSGIASTAATMATISTTKAMIMLTNSSEKVFENRNLDIETASRMGAKFEAGKFLFEYQVNGITQFRKVRTPDKKFWIEPSGQPLVLWNIDTLRDLPSPVGEPLVITEGEFDAIAAAQAWGGYVVSVPNGAVDVRTTGPVLVSEDTKFSYLWDADERLIREIDQFDKIILLTDDDKPGKTLRDELALRLGEARCWRVSFPKGCKDANDVLINCSASMLREVINNAVPMRPGTMVSPSEAPPNPNTTFFEVAWPKLNKHMRLVVPELCVVTGIPGHGKSQWVRALTFHLAEKHNWRIAYLTPEDPPHRLVRDMKRFAQRKYMKIYGGEPTYGMTSEQEAASLKWIDDHFRICVPNEDDSLTLELLEAEMASAALHHGCRAFVIDPWNELSHERGKRTDTEYIEQALVRLKRKCRRWGLILFIVAHPTKLQDGEKPSLYSISGSANWRNKSDHGVVIYRPLPDSKIVCVTIGKSKDHETMGTPGEVWMEFSPFRCDYYETVGQSVGE